MIKLVARTTVEDVAANARLLLSEEEIKQFKRELSDILDAFESLDELDTSEVEPSFHPLSLSDRLRQDEVDKETVLTRQQLGVEDHFVGPMVADKKKNRKD